MKQNSTPNGGSAFNERIRRRREAQAEIQEQVLQRSLERWERLALASAERSSAALTSIYEDTERTLSATASSMTREADRELSRIRRRIRHPWLPALLGAALALAIQAPAMYWGWSLIRPLLEQQALTRSGLTIAIDSAGSRWIRFPAGSVTWDPMDREHGRSTALRYFLIPDRS